MHLKTILNRVHKLKGFVYGNINLSMIAEQLRLEVEILARAGSQGICSKCRRKAPGYDTLPVRQFEFIPFWGILVFFIYAMRRVDCKQCGVTVEWVPWAEGKSPITSRYAWFLSDWAKRMAWSVVAQTFHTSWHHVQCAVKMSVEWGRAHMDLTGIGAIGVEEIAWGTGHRYATLVYQIDQGKKRLLWVAPGRSVKSFLGFFMWLGKESCAKIQFVCSDMWKPYLKVIAKKIPQAIHVLDRFHIMSHLNKAIDLVRNTEAKEMKQKGQEPLLSKSRWCLLKRRHNLTGKQREKLGSLLPFNLKTIKAYLMKEEFHQFWDYMSPWWAGKFLDAWCRRAMYSKIEPIKNVAKMLISHRGLILNWFRAKGEFSSGVVEGLNNKAKLSSKMAYGYKSFETLQLSLYHRLGELPQPEFTHKFF